MGAGKVSVEPAAVTLRLVAVIDAGFGRNECWDVAIADTLRALGWGEDAIAELFAIAEKWS